jgi:hypothetical protein
MARYCLKGATVKIGSTPGTAPATTLGQVLSGSADLGQVNFADLTVIGDETKVHCAGTKDAMTMEVVVLFDPDDANHDAVLDAYVANTKVTAGFTFHNTGLSKIWADGFWKNVTIPLEGPDGKMTATFSFQGTSTTTYEQ